MAKTESKSDDLASGGNGAESAGQKIADANRAEVASVVGTTPREVENGATLLKSGATVSEKVIDLDEGTTVTLKEDVVEEFYYPDTKRPSYRLRYRKGQTVPRTVIEQHNANVKARARAAEFAEKGEVDPDNPAGIDSSTLHSGTGGGLKVEQK